MKVFLSELAESKLLALTQYLAENWDITVREKFIKKLKAKIEQISAQPESCPKSLEVENLYKCVITKQTTLYYRISFNKEEIEIITIFDSRQNPDQLSKDIRN